MPTGMPGSSMRGSVFTRIEDFFNGQPNNPWDEYIAVLGARRDHMLSILADEYHAGSGSILDHDNNDVDAATIWHLAVDWFGRWMMDDGNGNEVPTPPERWRGRWWRGTTARGGYGPSIRSFVWACGPHAARRRRADFRG